MNKYRRIEVNAFRRRVAIVSGEWPQEIANHSLTQVDDGVSLDDSEANERVEPESPEGQAIIVEAIRSLERRLSPEARATVREVSKGLHAESAEFQPAIEKGLSS